jgi:hypothetical protein
MRRCILPLHACQPDGMMDDAWDMDAMVVCFCHQLAICRNQYSPARLTDCKHCSLDICNGFYSGHTIYPAPAHFC